MGRKHVFLANLGLRTQMFPLVSPPIGLLSLAAYLRQHLNVEIVVVNQRLENLSLKALAERAQTFEAEVVGLSAMTTYAYLLQPAAQAIREALPNALIVVGGPHASAVKSRILHETVADVVVPGEGEIAFTRVLEAFQDNASFADIPGIAWRDRSGEIVQNPGSVPMIEHLDDLPLPAYDLIDLPAYWRKQSIAPVVRRKYASIVSSRGCPYRCMWCHSIFGKQIRFHSPERIVEEIGFHQRQYDVRDFEFLDDTVNMRKDRIIRTTELMHQRGLRVKIAFPTGVRSDLFSEDVIEALHGAGMYYCGFALETGSPRLQKFVCKNLDIGRFVQAVAETARRRVYTQGFCMMGFPTETESELQQTIDVACNSMLHGVAFYTVTPFPGTPLYDYVREHNPEKLVNIRYDATDFSNMRVNLTDLPDRTLFAYQRKALRKFFLNPNRLFRLLRDYPQPHLLPIYLPIFIGRASKGLFGNLRQK